MQEPNMVVTGSDDQTVKVWNLLEIKNAKPPNKKKTRMQKHGDMDDDDDEDEDSKDEQSHAHNSTSENKQEISTKR